LGVVTEPESARITDKPDPAPAVVLLNAGLLHKVGPNRLSVEMARALASKGFRALRFDLSGIGDSRMAAAQVPARERAVSDVRSAMDFLKQRYGAERFVLAGLCSGSDNAHHTSLHDDRVVGTIHLDGYSAVNAQYQVRYYAGRALSWRVLRNRLRPRAEKNLAENPTPAGNARVRPFPTREQLAEDFKRIAARGVQLLYIYTAGAKLYNYKGQLREAFFDVPFGNLLEEEFFPEAAHTYTGVASRLRVVEHATEWVVQHWGHERRACQK
jgi:hypothetical protein